MGAVDALLYRHAGGAMLRAAVLPLQGTPTEWPTLSDPVSCRSWLRATWAIPRFAEATRYASRDFAARVEAVLNDDATDGKQIRRVTLSVIRYLLRSLGRPTPFGLFAGVAPVRVGGDTHAFWGPDHQAIIRADTLWLDDVVERLETLPALLSRLDVVVSDFIVDRGSRIELPRGAGRVSVRNTAVVKAVRDMAVAPICVSVLAAKLAAAFPGVPPATVYATLHGLVAHGVLITNLRAPMTVTDPLDYLIEALDHLADTAVEDDAVTVEPLRDIQWIIARHNATAACTDNRRSLMDAAISRMRRLSPAGRTPLAGDLHLDARVTVPAGLAEEMAYTVTALLRLTRQPRPDPSWNQWCREFWDRYGTGTVVPVAEAVHPDAGIGLPAGFASSMLTTPEDRVSRRDQELLRLAWEAVGAGRHEIVLCDDVIAAITADAPIDHRWIPPHVELAARIHASDAHAVDAGNYSFTVRPAQAFGTLTCRFGPAVPSAGLDATYASTPPATDGAMAVQMSFPPLFAHSENVARIPAYLPHVLPLGEHRADDKVTVVPLEDLGIVAVADGLHLISISRRRIVEPQVFHALALQKQAPPLARFLATLTRGFLARYTEFDWGPHATRLPFLPRVRYQRAILSPATWRITAADHAAMSAGDVPWELALERWRRRWKCPDTVELHDEDRSLRLALTVDSHRAVLRHCLVKQGHATLTETESATDTAWIGGHVHEIVMPFARATAPARNLVTGSLPLVPNRAAAHRPAAPDTRWLYAQVFTHPERLDDIIGTHLPTLLALLDDDRDYWFARYRSDRETDHLRLRIRTQDSTDYAAAAVIVGKWGQQLCDTGAASRLTLATYFPEVGRYGYGAAMDAAEAVFAADSRAVVLAMRLLPPQVIDPVALTALGMMNIADEFHANPDQASSWLLENLDTGAARSADRAVADQAASWAIHGTLPNGLPLPARLADAWQERRAALTSYRRSLPDNADIDRGLLALLHMHHNRARRIDRADEAICLRLARQAALGRRARNSGGRS